MLSNFWVCVCVCVCLHVWTGKTLNINELVLLYFYSPGSSINSAILLVFEFQQNRGQTFCSQHQHFISNILGLLDSSWCPLWPGGEQWQLSHSTCCSLVSRIFCLLFSRYSVAVATLHGSAATPRFMSAQMVERSLQWSEGHQFDLWHSFIRTLEQLPKLALCWTNVHD